MARRESVVDCASKVACPCRLRHPRPRVMRSSPLVGQRNAAFAGPVVKTPSPFAPALGGAYYNPAAGRALKENGFGFLVSNAISPYAHLPGNLHWARKMLPGED
jgi:hypothetical protein